MRNLFKENKVFKNTIIFVSGIAFTLISTFILLNALNMRVVPTSEIVSEASETPKEDPKESETQSESLNESGKRKKAYVVLFRVDESFVAGVYDENYDSENENILDMYTMEKFNFDGPTKWSDFIDFFNTIKGRCEKLDRELFMLTEDQFEKMFPGRILC